MTTIRLAIVGYIFLPKNKVEVKYSLIPIIDHVRMHKSTMVSMKLEEILKGLSACAQDVRLYLSRCVVIL